MAAPVPTSIPASFTAGDSLIFDITLADYSAADGYVLSYAFIRVPDGNNITFSSSANGAAFRISVTPATTVTWREGEYSGQAYVTKASTGERYKVWSGVLSIAPDFASAGQVDTRSQARKILDFIDASFEKIVKKQVVEAQIEGVMLRFRTLKELTEARSYWTAVVNSEVVAVGGSTAPRRCILAQFTSPA